MNEKWNLMTDAVNSTASMDVVDDIISNQQLVDKAKKLARTHFRPQQQDIFVSRAQGKTFQDIASENNITPGHARNIFQASTDRLRRMFTVRGITEEDIS